jgi:hypothetical protein
MLKEGARRRVAYSTVVARSAANIYIFIYLYLQWKLRDGTALVDVSVIVV